MEQNNVHVIFIGDEAVGKSSLVHSFISGEENQPCFDEYVPTESHGMTSVVISERKVILHDIGAKKLKSMSIGDRKKFFSIAQFVFLAYDCTRKDTFVSATSRWFGEIKPLIHSNQIMLIGTKTDLQKREVQIRDAEKFAAGNNLFFMEVSNRNRTNVDLTFRILSIRVSNLAAKNLAEPPQNPSPQPEIGDSQKSSAQGGKVAPADPVKDEKITKKPTKPEKKILPKPIAKLRIDVGKGRSGTIIIREGDNPNVLAKNFAMAFQLKPKQVEHIEKKIKVQLYKYYTKDIVVNPSESHGPKKEEPFWEHNCDSAVTPVLPPHASLTEIPQSDKENHDERDKSKKEFTYQGKPRKQRILFKLEVEVEDGRSQILEVPEGSSPKELTKKFAKEFHISYDEEVQLYQILKDHMKEHESQVLRRKHGDITTPNSK